MRSPASDPWAAGPSQPRRQVEPGTPAGVQNCRRTSWSTSGPPVAEQRVSHRRHRGGGAEQAGVAGDAAHGVGVQVVHLAHHHPAPDRAALGGSHLVAQPTAPARPVPHRSKAQRPGQPQRAGHARPEQAIQPLAQAVFQEISQQDERQVRIQGSAARFIAPGRRPDGGQDGGPGGRGAGPAAPGAQDRLVKADMGGPAGAVGQGTTHSDESVRLVGQRLIQRQCPLLHGLHGEDAGAQGLGQRR